MQRGRSGPAETGRRDVERAQPFLRQGLRPFLRQGLRAAPLRLGEHNGAQPAAAGCATEADETECEAQFRARIWGVLGGFWAEMVRFGGVLEGDF